MRLRVSLLLCALLAALTSCGFGGSSGTISDPSDSEDEETSTLSGSVSLGPVSGATVSIYKLSSDGSRGDLIDSATTNSSGTYSIAIPQDSGAVILVVTGGIYVEEASGSTVSVGSTEMTAVISSVTASRSASVTPLTHIAAQRAVALAGQGLALASAITDANDEIADAAGLSDVTDITAVLPADPTASLSSQGLSATDNRAKYALFLASLSQYAQNLGASDSLAVMAAFSSDFLNDGVFDGKNNGSAITVTGGGSLATNAWNAGVAEAQDDYIDNPNNSSGAGFTATSKSEPKSDTKAGVETIVDFSDSTTTASEISALAVDANNKIVVAGNSVHIPAFIGRYNSDGTLDTTFNGNGLQGLSIAQETFIRTVAIQSDGKIVVAGAAENGARFLFARFNSDGSLDSTFSRDGVYVMDLGVTSAINRIAIQSDGKVIGVGLHGSDAFVVRLNANGTLDKTFSDDGMYVATGLVSGKSFVATDLDIQADGKIIVSCMNNNLVESYIIRFNGNGSLDTTFGGGTGRIIDTRLYSASGIRSLASGKMIMLGAVEFARYNANGTIDDTLDGDYDYDGYVPLPGTVDGEAARLELQSDEKILISTWQGDSSVLRFNADGTPDTTFSTDGLAGNSSFLGGPADIGLFSSGKIVLPVQVSGSTGIAMLMFNSAGAADTAGFGSPNGYVYEDPVVTIAKAGDDSGYAMKKQSSGKLIVVGTATNTAAATSDFLIVRFTTAGALDTTFGDSGKKIIDIEGAQETDEAYDVVIDSSDRILVFGTSAGYTKLTVVRLTADGALDTSFSGDGIATTALGDSGYKGALQSDGKILAYSGLKIVRFTSAGAVDTTFGTNGLYTLSGSAEVVSGAIEVQSDNKILLYGSTSDYLNQKLVRLTANGALDTTFATSGVATIACTGATACYGNAIAIDANSKIVVAGGSVVSLTGSFTLARYDSSGVLDTNFGTAGKVSTEMSTAACGTSITEIDIASDGKITAGGSNCLGAETGFALTRYTASGSLDSSFGTLGKIVSKPLTIMDYANGMVVSSTGDIYLAGTSNFKFLPDGDMGPTGMSVLLRKYSP